MPLAVMAQQSSFDKFKQQQQDKFNTFKKDKQAEYDEFRRKQNEEYAEFMRRAWKQFDPHKPDMPIQEKEVPPVIYNEPQPDDKTKPQPDDKTKPQPDDKSSKPIKAPTPAPLEPDDNPIAVKPKVAVLPKPTPAPKPIAPVKPKEEIKSKRESISYYGSLMSMAFPIDDNLKLRKLEENAIADCWKVLSDSKYDIAIKTAMDMRKANSLCDWAFMDCLRLITEKHYGNTNEAVLMQAFVLSQAGYCLRLAMDDNRLYMLVSSKFNIFALSYFTVDNIRFYNITRALQNAANGKVNINKSDDAPLPLHICESKYGKEQSLSLQMAQMPKFGEEPTPKRTLSSKKGVTAAVSVNKNLIDFLNIYPQSYFDNNFTTRWAAYANTPLPANVRNALYPTLKKTIEGMPEKDAVDILLNWVQTAFTYGYDDKIWGGDRAFFAIETLHYPYSDCEDRAILFSRLVRDLVGLDVVLLYYPGHLATAVGFNDNVKGDYLTYSNKKYVVCDPTFLGAGVGRTMTGMNNKEAQVIVLK